MLILDRINPCTIVKNHFCTLYHAGTGKVAKLEVVIHLAAPFILGAFLSFCKKIYVTQSMSESLFNGFAIMGGFLISASFVLAEKRDASKKDKPNDSYEEILKETFYNTSFGILLCFLSVIFCAIYPLFLDDKGMPITSAGYFFSGLIFSLSAMFLLTILIVLKRLDYIFSK